MRGNVLFGATDLLGECGRRAGRGSGSVLTVKGTSCCWSNELSDDTADSRPVVDGACSGLPSSGNRAFEEDTPSVFSEGPSTGGTTGKGNHL